jgi:hypothetical protein
MEGCWPLLAVALREALPFIYTLLSNPNAPVLLHPASADRFNRSQAALISASGIAAKCNGTQQVRCQATSSA